MKRKKLTAAGIERYKPAKGRREIGDAGGAWPVPPPPTFGA